VISQLHFLFLVLNATRSFDADGGCFSGRSVDKKKWEGKKFRFLMSGNLTTNAKKLETEHESSDT
jgi:hypothetical protein